MVELAVRRGQRVAAGRLVRPAALLAGLIALLAAALLLGVGVGAVRIWPGDTLAIVLNHLGLGTGARVDPQDDAILWIIRLPRVLLGALVGGALAVAGATLQGVFRNPLADPGPDRRRERRLARRRRSDRVRAHGSRPGRAAAVGLRRRRRRLARRLRARALRGPDGDGRP